MKHQSISNVGVSKNRGFSTQIIHLNRVFHYVHHPFWGTPNFWKHPCGKTVEKKDQPLFLVLFFQRRNVPRGSWKMRFLVLWSKVMKEMCLPWRCPRFQTSPKNIRDKNPEAKTILEGKQPQLGDLYTHHGYLGGGWQLKDLWIFHLENWGRWTHFWRIFFRWVGETTNQITVNHETSYLGCSPLEGLVRIHGWSDQWAAGKGCGGENRGIETPKMMLPDVPLEVGINGL